MWVHRGSEDPACTKTECYWKKPRLSGVGTSLKCLTLSDFGATNITPLPADDFLQETIAAGNAAHADSQLLRHFNVINATESLGLHHLFRGFVANGGTISSQFMSYASTKMQVDVCDRAAEETIQKSDSRLWHELRYGRINASKMYDAAHCKTPNGIFIQQVVGVSKLRDTMEMEKGEITRAEGIECFECRK